LRRRTVAAGREIIAVDLPRIECTGIQVKNSLDPPNVGGVTEASPATFFQETSMPRFDIPDMTCGHCVKTITQAVQAIDPKAQIQADLASHSIGVTSTASAASLSAAIAAAGYANTSKA
jgi:copper chaperone